MVVLLNVPVALPVVLPVVTPLVLLQHQPATEPAQVVHVPSRTAHVIAPGLHHVAALLQPVTDSVQTVWLASSRQIVHATVLA